VYSSLYLKPTKPTKQTKPQKMIAEVSNSSHKKLSGYQYFVSENFLLSQMHVAKDNKILFEEVTFHQAIREVARKWRELSESGRASWRNFAGGSAEKPRPPNPFEQRAARGSSREPSVVPEEAEEEAEESGYKWSQAEWAQWNGMLAAAVARSREHDVGAAPEPFIDDVFTRSSTLGTPVNETKLQMQGHVLDNKLDWTSTHDYVKTHGLALAFGLAVEAAAKVQAANPREFIANCLWPKQPASVVMDRPGVQWCSPIEWGAVGSTRWSAEMTDEEPCSPQRR